MSTHLFLSLVVISIKNKSRIFGTYKIDVMPHGFHIQKIAIDIDVATICPFTYDKQGLPH